MNMEQKKIVPERMVGIEACHGFSSSFTELFHISNNMQRSVWDFEYNFFFAFV